MIKKVELEKKVVTIYYNEKYNNYEVPVVILNSYDEDGKAIWNRSKEIVKKEFILVSITNIKWNDELTPWKAKSIFKGEDDFTGNADKYIEELSYKIIPQLTDIINTNMNVSPEYFVLGGYSLAGLFAIYTSYKTKTFKRVFSASGSMWYPGFLEYIKENSIKGVPSKMYFSLGNKEAKTRNKIMSTVESNTRDIVKIYKEKGIEVIYFENEGNHFQNIVERIVKAIKWTIE